MPEIQSPRAQYCPKALHSGLPTAPSLTRFQLILQAHAALEYLKAVSRIAAQFSCKSEADVTPDNPLSHLADATGSVKPDKKTMHSPQIPCAREI